MKTLLATFSLLFAFQVLAEVHPSLEAVKAADKARVAAMQSGGAREAGGGVFG